MWSPVRKEERAMRNGPRKPVCGGCPHNLYYSDPIPQRAMGVMMHLGERFCTGGKKARRFKRGDPKIYVPGWCPKRKTPCELRVYAFKSVNEWWLHMSLEKGLGRSLLPEGHNYALVKSLTTKLSPQDFWKHLEFEPYQDILDVQLESYSVLEIDDGLKPVFFYYVDGGFTLTPLFNAEMARQNKKEG